MMDIAIEQVLTARYRTSAEGDRHTNILREGLALSTQAATARLAIGRSLSVRDSKLDAGNIASIDAKCRDVQGQTLFGVGEVAAWIGLIVTHSQLYGNPIQLFDDFRNAVRFHWHCGAHFLSIDWKENDENYDRFVQFLITRRTALPDELYRTSSGSK